jgi:hypothetical protein
MDKKQETYLIPEKGPEGSLTGRTIVYRPGEWSERYNLLKAAAEDDPGHKRNFVDIELKDLKRDQALWSEEKKGYFDARGKKYNYSQMVKQNQFVAQSRWLCFLSHCPPKGTHKNVSTVYPSSPDIHGHTSCNWP